MPQLNGKSILQNGFLFKYCSFFKSASLIFKFPFGDLKKKKS